MTGGAGGIGSAFVQRFVNDGAKVAIIDLNESNAKQIIEILGNDNVKYFKLDVTKRDDCFQVVKQIANDFGKVNHLVNSVAYFGSKVKFLYFYLMHVLISRNFLGFGCH